MTGSTSLLREMMQFLAQHAPYSQLAPVDLEFLASHCAIAYFSPGAEVLRPNGEVPDSLLILRSGQVRWERPGVDAQGDPVATTLSVGDSFPVGALYAERPIESLYRAVGDVFVLRVNREVFQALLARSPACVEHCKRRLATLLDLSRRQQRVSRAAEGLDAQGQAQPLEQLIRRACVSCHPEESLQEVLERMSDAGVACVTVVDQERAPVGIMTLRDLIPRVILAQRSLETPVAEVMTHKVSCLPHDATAAEAALMMVDRDIHHVPVVKNQAFIGVVSERDLFALQRRSLKDLLSMVGRAASLADLTLIAADIRAYTLTLVAQGVDARTLTGLISRLTDRLTEKVVLLSAAHFNLPPTGWTWLAFGSEGRQEQTLRSDQDNGLLILDPSLDRQVLGQFAQLVNETLAACGSSLCQGGIMASHDDHRLDRASWMARFQAWIEASDPDSLMNAGIYFDLRPIAGDGIEAMNLHHETVALAHNQRRFLMMMAQQALTFRPPAGLGGGLVAGWLNRSESSVIDVKLQGTMLFVLAVRVLALSHGITETGTRARIEKLIQRQVVSRREAQAWLDSFEFLQALRLRRQADGGPDMMAVNQLDTRELSVLDQKILVEAFRQARRLQQNLAMAFGLA